MFVLIRKPIEVTRIDPLTNATELVSVSAVPTVEAHVPVCQTTLGVLNNGECAGVCVGVCVCVRVCGCVRVCAGVWVASKGTN
jgi:hypothetical protein